MEGAIRIGELSRRTGVSPEVLRAWEQRYGLLAPERSSGGFRLYSAADEARIRRVTTLIAAGVSASEAAREALAAEQLEPSVEPAYAQGALPERPLAGQSQVGRPLVGQPQVGQPYVGQPYVEQLADRLRSSLDAFDGPGAHAALDRLLASVSVDVVLAEVLVPYLRDLGDRWVAGRASVAQEHFASHLIRGRLLALARDWEAGDGPALLLACLPGEAHDLGLIMFGILAARRGWRVVFLGADTPLDTLEATVRELRPALMVLVATTPSLLAEHADGVRALAGLTRTTIAGLADPQAAASVGAGTLPSDVVEAAQSIAR